MNEATMDSWPAMPLAVVVGAAGGLGMAVARRLGQNHRLVLADRNTERLETLAKQLQGEGHFVLPVVCDVTQPDSVAELARKVEKNGSLRTLAHVVGLSPSMGTWDQIMSVNLIGPTLVADAFLPLAEPSTAAIFVASLAAHGDAPADDALRVLRDPLTPTFLADLVAALGEAPTPALSYQLSKNALVRMCKRRAAAWGARQARIVSISPGLIATPMGALEFRNQPSKFDLLAKTPLGRQGGMLEIADAIEFLASDRASFITGVDLLVDGGISAALHHAD